MSGIEFNLDASGIAHAGERFAKGSKGVAAATARALNRSSDMARTQMVRSLTVQTGLKRKVIVAALKSSKRAAAGSLFAVISSHGGDVRLKSFGPKETAGGVSASPWGQRRVYAKTFIRGGTFPNRHGGPFGGNGHVYVRSGRGRFPLKAARSGLYIPVEMITGRTEETFFAAVNSVLPARLDHELSRLLGAL